MYKLHDRHFGLGSIFSWSLSDSLRAKSCPKISVIEPQRKLTPITILQQIK